MPHGRQSRLITPPVKKNRAFPTGNALLYISLLSVAFGRVRPFRAHPVFYFVSRPMILTAYSCGRNCIKVAQFLRSSSFGSSCKITLGIFQGFFQKFLQLIRIIIHPMVGLRKFDIVVWNVVKKVRFHEIIFLAHGNAMVDPAIGDQ